MTTLARLESGTPPGAFFGWEPSALSAVRRRGVNLAVWRRGFDSQFSLWCERVAATGVAFDARIERAGELGFEALGASAAVTTLRDDARQLFELYLRVSRVKHARVQLRSVGKQTCPKFHIDCLRLRLITTYAGPATEWMTPQGPSQLERFDVALMKGSDWPGERAGLMHRSPVVGDEPRLVLTIDRLA